MNNLPRIKRDLIAGLDERRMRARAYVESLPPTLTVHADSGWTVRDLILHLTSVEADMISALHCAIEGAEFSVDLRGQATVPDLYELRRQDAAETNWQQLLAEWERVRRQLRGVVLAFPLDLMDKRFSNPFFQPYNLSDAVRACYTHEAHHLAEMRAAAASIA